MKRNFAPFVARSVLVQDARLTAFWSIVDAKIDHIVRLVEGRDAHLADQRGL